MTEKSENMLGIMTKQGSSLAKLTDMIEFLIPNYVQRGKTIACGSASDVREENTAWLRSRMSCNEALPEE